MGGAQAHATSEAQADILQALLALGYNDKGRRRRQLKLPGDVGVSEGIKLAPGVGEVVLKDWMCL